MATQTRRPAARPAARAAAPTRPVRARARRPFVSRAVLVCLLPPLLATLAGLPYYRLPLAERLLSPLHPWFGPSGYVGQTAGFLALVLFVFLWLYPVRKRLRFLGWTGSLGRWLDAHVVVGFVVPVVGAVHAAWRFEGLIGLGYASMLVVAMSGVVGRYLYVHVPRARNGLEMSREEVASERRRLTGEIVASTELPPELVLGLLKPTPGLSQGGNLLSIVARMVRDDFERRRATRKLVRYWKRNTPAAPPDRARLRRVTRLARREMAFSQQIRMLEHTNRVFRFWHTAHRPFAATAFLAVAVHVTVVVALGATWIRLP